MTLNEFMSELKNLRNSGYAWKCINHVVLRTKLLDNTLMCPITAVCYYKTGKLISTSHWQDAADMIELSFLDACGVASAADCGDDNNPLRTTLLNACGINVTDQ